MDTTLQASDLYTAISGSQTDSQYFMTSFRNKLASVKKMEAQSRLWSDISVCTKRSAPEQAANCQANFQTTTLSELFYLKDPYWAHPIFNFNTGALTQFTPRLNSSSMYEILEDRPLPQDCRANTDALYVHYDASRYNATFCMLNIHGRSPWSFQRTRQDFTEELYIRVSRGGDRKYSAKITMNTTAGYFELPSYMSKSAGLLMNQDPIKKCNETQRCKYQWGPDPVGTESNTSHATERPPASSKGPLATIALALFGPGSIMDDKVEVGGNATADSCARAVPLADFFGAGQPCFDASSSSTADESRASYLANFLTESEADAVITIAMDAAAFLVHDAWMTFTLGGFSLARLTGPDVSAPDLSDTSMVVLSVLLGIFLACLLAMSVFCSLTPGWTDKLDSFAMLRIGAAQPRSFPLMVSYRADHVEALDRVPGWVGDRTDYKGEDAEHVCELGLGVQVPLKQSHRYRCYDADHEMPMPPKAD